MYRSTKIILFICGFIFFHQDLSAKSICLTGTTVKMFPKYGEAFVNGAEMALSEDESVDFEIKKFYYDKTPLAALESYRNMRKEKCDYILGFSTGNDLITISEEAKKGKIPIFSIYGDQSEIINSNPYIHTLQPKPDYLLKPLFFKLKKEHKRIRNVLIVTAVDRGSMTLYRNEYVRNLKTKGIKFKNIDILEGEPQFEILNKYLLSESVDTLILLTRSSLAAKVTSIVKKKNKKILILGTKYFGSSALPAYLKYLEDKNVDAYFSRHGCLCDSNREFRLFKVRYKKRFKVSPMVISASSFDLVNYILKSQNEVGTTNYMKLLNTSFKGITGVEIYKKLKIKFTRNFVIKISNEKYLSI